MRQKLIVLTLALGLATVMAIVGLNWVPGTTPVGVGEAAYPFGAADATWAGSITLMNPTTNAAIGVIDYYAENNPTLVHEKSFSVPAHGSVSFPTTAETALPDGFLGAAEVSSDQPLLANFVFFARESGIDRAVYNGFSAGEASTDLFIPAYVREAYDQNSMLSIQNTEDSAATVTLDFYNSSTGSRDARIVNDTIPAKTMKSYKADTLQTTEGSLSAGWLGSVIVTSDKKVVGAVFQPYMVAGKLVSFEGVAAGGTTVYVPSALRNAYGAKYTTFIAIQNTTGNSVDATVRFYDSTGAEVAVEGPIAIGARAKKSVDPRSVAGLSDGYSGAAIVEATGGNVAVVVNIGSNLPTYATAFSGVTATSQSVGLSYVRWGDDDFDWRGYIAVQNVNPSHAAVTATVTYYDKDGGVIGTPQTLSAIPYLSKGNSNPSQVLPPGEKMSKGSAIVTADGPIVVLVNAVTTNQAFSASYTGIPFTP